MEAGTNTRKTATVKWVSVQLVPTPPLSPPVHTHVEQLHPPGSSQRDGSFGETGRRKQPPVLPQPRRPAPVTVVRQPATRVAMPTAGGVEETVKIQLERQKVGVAVDRPATKATPSRLSVNKSVGGEDAHPRLMQGAGAVRKG